MMAVKYFDTGMNMAYYITYVKEVGDYDNINSIGCKKASL